MSFALGSRVWSLMGGNENVVLNPSDLVILSHPKCSLASLLTLPFPLHPFTTHRGKEKKDERRRNKERFCGVRWGWARAAPCPPASLWATGQANQQAELLDRNRKLPAPSPGPFSAPDFSPEGSRLVSFHLFSPLFVSTNHIRIKTLLKTNKVFTALFYMCTT